MFVHLHVILTLKSPSIIPKDKVVPLWRKQSVYLNPGDEFRGAVLKISVLTEMCNAEMLISVQTILEYSQIQISHSITRDYSQF